MAATIRDVALKAGVSAATVSKVMNNNPSISEATAERIKQVMRELDYHPNLRARNFAKQETGTVLFATALSRNCVFENPHIFEIMVGLEKALERKGLVLSIANVNKENCMELLGEQIARKSIDAIVLHISIVSRELERIILKSEIPHIVLGCPNYKTQLCWIDNNNILSGEMAASYLITCGYSRPAFIGGYKNDIGSANRLQGYKNIMASKKLPEEDYVRLGESSVENGELMMAKLLELDKPPDSVVCANNYLAYGALRATKHAGLKLPRDMGLITFDAYPFTGITKPKMTTVDIDVYDMGKQAGEIILKKIKRPNLQVQSYTTLANLIVNDSTK